MRTTLKSILLYIAIGIFGAASIICICCSIFLKPNSINPSSLSITCPNSIILTIGERHSLDIECSDKSAAVSLSVSDNNIAELDGFDVIAKAVGITYVKVDAKSSSASARKSVKIIVEENISSLELGIEENITLYMPDKNKNEAYTANLFDYINYTPNTNIGYNFSENDIVTIKNNQIKARNIGQVTITFYALSKPEIQSVHNVTVLKIDPALNYLGEDIISLKIGKSKSVSYEITPSYYTGAAIVNLEIENQEIASIEGKQITGVSTGETKLNIYLNDQKVAEKAIVVTSSQNASVTPPTEGNTQNEPTNTENNNENQNLNTDNENTDSLNNGSNENEESLTNNESEPPSQSESQNEEENTLDPNEETNNETESSIVNPNENEESEINTSGYRLVLIPGANCQIDEENITLLSSSANFTYEIYDGDNNKITSSSEISFQNVSLGISVSTALGGRINLSSTVNGSFTICIASLNLNQTFNVLIS